MAITRPLVIGFLAALLGACAADPGYHWANYSEQAYRYKNNPTEQNRASYQTALTAVVNHAALKNLRVPPGVYAELAFLALEEKNRAQAAWYLRQEQQLYPEAAALTQAWLNRIEAGAAQ